MISSDYGGPGKHVWETVTSDDPRRAEQGPQGMSYTDRLRVPGGWIYRVTYFADDEAQDLRSFGVFVATRPGEEG